MKDLHIHTKYSDGEDDEYEIIKKLKEKGINEFAIADHDTIVGSKKVYELVKDDDYFNFHSGVELSCRVKEFNKGINVHLLYYDFDYNDKHLISVIDEISRLRLKRIKLMKDLIKEVYNVEIKDEEIKEVSKQTKSIGKPHFYTLLLKYGNYDREEYFRNMDNLRGENLKLDLTSLLELLKNNKGFATLAHPIEIMKEYGLSYKEIDSLVGFLKEKGLKGLETRHSSHTEKDYLEFSKIAKKYNLIETQGSDYHGIHVKPHVHLGVCKKTSNITL